MDRTTNRPSARWLAPAALAGALAALALLGAERAQATFPGDNGRIAYWQLTDPAAASSQIRTVLPDGTGVRELTPPNGQAREATFSANGAWIAFTGTPPSGGGGEIYRMRANGKRKQRLTRNNRLEDMPAWSPDGKWIVFVRQTRASRELFAMRNNGRRVMRLTRNRLSESAPTWSPNGRWIAYTRTNRQGNEVILKMRLKGRKVQRVTAGALPSWSPDSRRIAFNRFAEQSGDQDIFTVLRNGNGLERLTDDPPSEFNNDVHPEYSPDGEWITFALNGELQLIRADGTDQQPLLSASGPLATSSWQSR